MALVVDMDDMDKDEFMIRARRNKTTASAVVRDLIKKWMIDHPDSPKTKMRPSVE